MLIKGQNCTRREIKKKNITLCSGSSRISKNNNGMRKLETT